MRGFMRKVRSTAELESGGERGLIFEIPKHLEHPAGRVNLTAAHLLEYWSKKGAIPRYDGIIDGLRSGADEIFKAANPVRTNAKVTGSPALSASPCGLPGYATEVKK